MGQVCQKNGFLTAGSIRYRTGKNWEDYRKEFGFQKKGHEFTEEDCIRALRQAADELGEFFTKREYEAWRKSNGMPSERQIAVRFGSFNKGKIAAGLLTNEPWGKIYTDEEILDALRACSKVYGELFSERDYAEWREKHPDAPGCLRQKGCWSWTITSRPSFRNTIEDVGKIFL